MEISGVKLNRNIVTSWNDLYFLYLYFVFYCYYINIIFFYLSFSFVRLFLSSSCIFNLISLINIIDTINSRITIFSHALKYLKPCKIYRLIFIVTHGNNY